MLKKLEVNDVYRKCDTGIFKQGDTSLISAFEGIIGQGRVQEALSLAVGITHPYYNVFALGDGGIGKTRFIRNYLSKVAYSSSIPCEYCYVHNFENTDKPIYLEFEAGEGKLFKQNVDDLIKELKTSIPSFFNGEKYKSQIGQISHQYEKQQSELTLKMQREATKKNIAIIKNPQGFVITAINHETQTPMTPEEVNKLNQEKRDEIEKNVMLIQKELNDLLSVSTKIEQEKQKKLEELKQGCIKDIVTPYIQKIITKWNKNSKAINYLNSLQENIINDPSYFLQDEKKDDENPLSQLLLKNKPKNNENLYVVNLLVDRSENLANKTGAPVVILQDPTHSQLFGRIDYSAQLGGYSTNLSLVHKGALHEANGGYLVVNARPLLETPGLWQQIKKIIKTQTIPFDFENPIGGISLLRFNPEPIPFTGKIILLGESYIYNALWNYDPEFKELFKITAEFDHQIPFDEKGALIYSEVASSIVKKENLLPLNKEALASLVEIGARYAGSQKHLTSNVSFLMDIIREADFIAQKNKQTKIGLPEITSAFSFKKRLRDRIPNYMQDKIKDQTITIKTSGEEVGQINGLAVISINEFSFGQPQRISCSVFKGKKDIIDIESNVKLAGSIYSKGIMILSAFLHSRFSQEKQLSFSSALTFEQSYGMIDGDSASAASAFVLLSALSGIPIKQSIAVTGSMDQKGRVQAIGGVNEKIEGFFDICTQNGLDGSHGVIIPSSNAQNLMLKRDILSAIEQNLFHIYTIDHVDEGIELLTGVKAGVLKQNSNKYNENEINGIIQKKWLNSVEDKK